ncbi:probable E3 ubiquitin-protein ligase HERC1 [Pollicipes pollicipes]|uniref:probable E3 ubiquitin-protein ligase HERC1 n=1 Tax=Pollicipes pollicipes TaxID=41117 RepID=UPI0018856A46|nr:probable E3 ubiquitin-protein ligase HERC1 [Pollicipes pollicipes]
MAGVDRGLRVGGVCLHRSSARRAVLLGMLKQGVSSVRLQWEDGEATVSDAAVSSLQPCEPPPFVVSRLGALSAGVIRQLSRLSGITDEVDLMTAAAAAAGSRERLCSRPH